MRILETTIVLAALGLLLGVLIAGSAFLWLGAGLGWLQGGTNNLRSRGGPHGH
jgi:hypothetical protein